MIDGPIRRAQYKHYDERVQKICQGGIESPEGFRASASTSGSIKGEVGSGDLRRELGESLLERGRGVGIALWQSGTISRNSADNEDHYLPEPRHTCSPH